MRINFFGVLLFLAALSKESQAQPDTIVLSDRKISYYNSFLTGGLMAEKGNGSTLSASFTHGVRIKRFSIGAGMGYDAYLNWRTMPVFASVSYDFAPAKKSTLFLQLTSGYSKAWYIIKGEWLPEYDVNDGAMISSLVGYRIKVDQFSLYMAAGYKFQRIRYDYSTTCTWCSSAPAPSNRYAVKYDIERIVLMIGFGLH